MVAKVKSFLMQVWEAYQEQQAELYKNGYYPDTFL